ncbi:7-cyano-7-deazaguanine synthase [Candidatus Woesearchaeota archaeon]|nr:7-cyano-7-deazaguanine synthase [Candidatus Woesearchaeota archaeon]
MNKKIKDIVYTISPNSKMRFLNDKYLWMERDIFILASIIFNIETVFRMKEKVNQVKISISEETAELCNLTALKNEIMDLLNYVLMYDVEVIFEVNQEYSKYKRDKDLEFNKCNNVCLFSGGIDSFSGIVTCKKEYKDIEGLFVAHGDQPRGVNIVSTLYKNALEKLKIPIHTLYAPPMKRYGYSQLRGFLYCMYGAIYMSLLKADNLLVTECGPTMYQPKFSPFDSVTMTTHPYVLKRTKNIIELFLRRKVHIITPFENLTKAEVFINSPIKNQFQFTHSCISLGTGRNCGHCYGCVVRKIGSIIADLKDTEYDINPFTEDYQKGENLVSLARFSHDVLLKYETMNFTSKENIFIYKKQRLFKRFALDTFAAIYILKEKGFQTNPYIENSYEAVINKLGIKKIKERIENVRSGKFIPNFDKEVN